MPCVNDLSLLLGLRDEKQFLDTQISRLCRTVDNMLALIFYSISER